MESVGKCRVVRMECSLVTSKSLVKNSAILRSTSCREIAHPDVLASFVEVAGIFVLDTAAQMGEEVFVYLCHLTKVFDSSLGST